MQHCFMLSVSKRPLVVTCHVSRDSLSEIFEITKQTYYALTVRDYAGFAAVKQKEWRFLFAPEQKMQTPHWEAWRI